jgi:hypothetical protein
MMTLCRPFAALRNDSREGTTMGFRKTVSKLIRRHSEAELEKELERNPNLEFTAIKVKELEALESKMVQLEKVARWVLNNQHVVDSATMKPEVRISWTEALVAAHEVIHGRATRKVKLGQPIDPPKRDRGGS